MRENNELRGFPRRTGTEKAVSSAEFTARDSVKVSKLGGIKTITFDTEVRARVSESKEESAAPPPQEQRDGGGFCALQ